MTEEKSGVRLGGVANFKIRRNGEIIDEWEEHNIVTDQGINHILGASLANRSQITAWYIGLLDNYTPVAGSTMTNFGANEITTYDEAARQAWTLPAADVTGKSVTNSASTATFTISATDDVYGIFIASSSTKSETASTSLAGILFSAAKSLVDDDELIITYTFGGADDGV